MEIQEIIESTKEMKDDLAYLKAKRDSLVEQLEQAIIKEKEIADELLMRNKALIVVQNTASEMQKSIEFRISGLVTKALNAVYPEDKYQFHLRYEMRRGKTECDLIFEKEGRETKDILASEGGGVADVGGLSLRFSVWSLNKSRPVFLMDEPMKFISPDLQQRGAEMLKTISEKLSVQIIMISHLRKIMGNIADNVIDVNQLAAKQTILKRRKRNDQIKQRRRNTRMGNKIRTRLS